uniref:Mediator of RNA polymerase II transcription subunit 7 n=1 Tax=Oryza barthii TaxID=65489 RepID=A0A0D3G190_9ORYZ
MTTNPTLVRLRLRVGSVARLDRHRRRRSPEALAPFLEVGIPICASSKQLFILEVELVPYLAWPHRQHILHLLHITDYTRITKRIPHLHLNLHRQLMDHINSSTDVVLPSLEDQGVRQLYPKSPDIDFKKELRTLNRELQLHILELADILVERPSQYARRVEDISLIFKNLHHLLNSLRPHQEERGGTKATWGITANLRWKPAEFACNVKTCDVSAYLLPDVPSWLARECTWQFTCRNSLVSSVTVGDTSGFCANSLFIACLCVVICETLNIEPILDLTVEKLQCSPVMHTVS